MSSLFVFAVAWFVVVVSGTSAVRRGRMSRSTYRVLLGVMAVMTALVLGLSYARVRRDASAAAGVTAPAEAPGPRAR